MVRRQEPGAGAARAARSIPRLTILLVEDEVLVRFAAADLLRGEGHEVIEAANGEEALTLVGSGLELDLMLSDLRMPGGVDGLELTRRAQALRPGLPILLASGHLPEAVALDVGLLAKPYSDEALLAAVAGSARPAGEG